MLRLHRKSENAELYRFFKNVLGFCPRHIELYRTAFTHRSKSHSLQSGYRVNNERLEFLGDAMLSSIVAEYLYRKYPYKEEGFMTELRSKMVSRANLNKTAHKMGLVELIEYTRQSQGIFKSIEGDAFEALVGAMYLDRGYKFTRRIVVDRIIEIFMDVDEMAHSDWNFKSKLIDWGQKNHRHVAFEHLPNDTYDGKRPEYRICVTIDGEERQSAVDYTIKSAEQLAAEKTYKQMLESGEIRSS